MISISKSNNDYTNIMKLNKKYNDLLEMYYFNLINDCYLFINNEIKLLYDCKDKKKGRINQYVYWYNTNNLRILKIMKQLNFLIDNKNTNLLN